MLMTKGCAHEFRRDFQLGLISVWSSAEPLTEFNEKSVRPGREMSRNLAPDPDSR
jgi:hypothetical protein